MAIPTVPDILAGVAAKTYTPQQATVWIDLHIGQAVDLAVDAALDMDAFAALAMQSLLADRKFIQDAMNEGKNPFDTVAQMAFQQAQSMKKARLL
jgi:hypothetical protein